jgi:peroxiredoxin
MQIKKAFIFTLVTVGVVFHSLAQGQKYKDVNQAKGLPVGAMVEDFTASDQFDKEFRLSEQLAKGPVVLIFYRGQWCPVCNRHLGQLQDSLAMIEASGARLIAVAPEQPPYLKSMATKTEAEFSLLYDEAYRISNAFDVTFLPDQASIDAYNKRLDANLSEANTDDSDRLPIPATFVINQNGEIVWRHFDPDYRKRASAKDIMDALEKLK